mgnify:CR=1 FL=1
MSPDKGQTRGPPRRPPGALAFPASLGYIRPMRKLSVALIAAALSLSTGACSKRQIAPGILTGVGAGVFAGGVGYRVSLPEEDSVGLFGAEPQQKAGTSILVFGGIAIMLAGVVWSATTPLCQEDADCFGDEVCDQATSTCISLAPPAPDGEVEAEPGPASALPGPLDPPVPARFALALSVDLG